MNNFNRAIKKEICDKEFIDKNEINGILFSLLYNSAKYDEKNDTFKIKHHLEFIIDKITYLFKKIYKLENIKNGVIKSKSKNSSNYIQFKILKTEIKKLINISFLEEKIKKNNKKFLKGVITGTFLANGSINPLDSQSYHLELKSKNKKYIKSIEKILYKQNIFTKIIKRSKNFILYIKKGECIADFLKYIEANNAIIDFEDQRINRDFNNNIQRLNNIDLSNLKKTIYANQKQIYLINKLEKKDRLNSFSDNIQKYCKLIIENPNSSLSQITILFQQKYNKKLSRSTIKYYATKIEKESKKY